MARKKTAPKDVLNKIEKPDPLDLFSRKPGRAIVMTEAASMAADDSAKNKKPSVSSRTKNAVCQIRREDPQ